LQKSRIFQGYWYAPYKPCDLQLLHVCSTSSCSCAAALLLLELLLLLLPKAELLLRAPACLRACVPARPSAGGCALNSGLIISKPIASQRRKAKAGSMPMAIESRSLYSGHFTPTALSSQSSLDGGRTHYPQYPSNSKMSAMAQSGSSSGLLNEREVVRSAGREAISQFLDGHTCFSVLRASGKVVVFDTRIPIQLAFYALVEHGKLLLARGQRPGGTAHIPI